MHEILIKETTSFFVFFRRGLQPNKELAGYRTKPNKNINVTLLIIIVEEEFRRTLL